MEINANIGAIIEVKTKNDHLYSGKVVHNQNGVIALLPQLLLSQNATISRYGIKADDLVQDCTADSIVPPVYVDLNEVESWGYYCIPNNEIAPTTTYYGITFIGDIPVERRNYYGKYPDISPYALVCKG